MFGGTTGWEYNLEVRSLEPEFNGEKDDVDRREPIHWKWTLLHVIYKLFVLSSVISFLHVFELSN